MSFAAVVAVKIRLWGITRGTSAVIRDVTFLTSGNGFDLVVIFVFKIRDKELPIPVVVQDMDFRQIIGFKLLILGGVGIIKSPLFKRDISADKVN